MLFASTPTTSPPFSLTSTLFPTSSMIVPSTILMRPSRMQSINPGGSTWRAPDRATAKECFGIVCGRSCWPSDLTKSSPMILNINSVDHFPSQVSAIRRWNMSGCLENGSHAVYEFGKVRQAQCKRFIIQDLQQSVKITAFRMGSFSDKFSVEKANEVCGTPGSPVEGYCWPSSICPVPVGSIHRGQISQPLIPPPGGNLQASP